MVTKRKVITEREFDKQVNVYPERILYSYRRSSDFGLVVSIRYEPRLKVAAHGDEMCTEYTDEFFFLSRLHYEELLYAVRALRWPLDLDYETFMRLLTDFTEESNLDPDDPYIVQMAFFEDGQVELCADETPRVIDLFSGLCDHLRIIEGDSVESDEETETFKVSAEALPVWFDTDWTLPCKYTLFNTTDQRLYNDAVARVRRDYQLDPSLEDDEFDVLLWNSVQYTMSTLDSVVAVLKDDTWYVPHAVSGTRQDPLRTVLLEQGLVQEALFNVQRLEQGDDVLLISAQHGIRRGVLMGSLPEPLSRYTRNRRSEGMSVKRERLRVDRAKAQKAAELVSQAVRHASANRRTGIPGTSVLEFARKKKPKKKAVKPT